MCVQDSIGELDFTFGNRYKSQMVFSLFFSSPRSSDLRKDILSSGCRSCTRNGRRAEVGGWIPH